MCVALIQYEDGDREMQTLTRIPLNDPATKISFQPEQLECIIAAILASSGEDPQDALSRYADICSRLTLVGDVVVWNVPQNPGKVVS
jgi:hypothetical protein